MAYQAFLRNLRRSLSSRSLLFWALPTGCGGIRTGLGRMVDSVVSTVVATLANCSGPVSMPARMICLMTIRRSGRSPLRQGLQPVQRLRCLLCVIGVPLEDRVYRDCLHDVEQEPTAEGDDVIAEEHGCEAFEGCRQGLRHPVQADISDETQGAEADVRSLEQSPCADAEQEGPDEGLEEGRRTVQPCLNLHRPGDNTTVFSLA